MSFILALDQGTTSSRAIVFDSEGRPRSVAQIEFPQLFPQPGYVEHDPNDIWSSQIGAAVEAISRAGLSASDIAAIGIANQRETTIVWDRTSGQPVCNALVWQDRRTAPLCDDLKQSGHEPLFQRKTGLLLDAYFSGTKIRWILDNVPGARVAAQAGRLAFGTVDTYLLWRLTAGHVHATDASNASRTLLYNIHTGSWDDELLELLRIPRALLPEVRASSGVFGRTSSQVLPATIPITGIAGDQQAALFGQMCTQPGMVKNTYGTGCFMLLQTGPNPVPSTNNMLTTVAWQLGDKTSYALEGSIFIAGAVVQWLRDGLGIIRAAADVETLARTVPDSGGVYLVPAFAGLGAPHWDPYARGTLAGITRGTTAAHIARAALEAIALQVADVLDAMQADSGLEISQLRADGGAAANDLLMQLQADILGVPVARPRILETTALGAAYLAGLAAGFWSRLDDVASQWQLDRSFTPEMPPARVQALREGWRKAVQRSLHWTQP